MYKYYFLLMMLFGTPLFAQNEADFATDIQVKSVPIINSSQLDFSPTYYQNGLLFISNRATDASVPKSQRKDPKINDYYMTILHAQWDDQDGVLEAPTIFSRNLIDEFHEGPLCFSPDGMKLYFTRNNNFGIRKDNEKKNRYLKIYTADKNGNDWANIQELPFSTDGYEEAHPSLSADGTILIFTSNRPGGFGGMDLYQSRWVNNQWTEPQNLGPSINSNQNELFPFLHSDGTLFFASNGWGGQGGLDIYLTHIDQLSSITNLGVPVNSEFDDFGLILNPQKTQGYFSSNREGGKGKDDIYQFNWDEKIVSLPPSENKALTTICLYDKNTEAPIKQGIVKVLKRRRDGALTSLSGKRLLVMQPSTQKEQYKVKMEFPQPNTTYENRTYKTDDQGAFQLALRPDETYIIVAEHHSYEKIEKTIYTDPATDWNVCIPLAKKTIDCLPLKGRVQQTISNDLIANANLTLKNNCTGKEWQSISNAYGEFDFPCQSADCDFSLSIQKEGYQGKVVAINRQQFLNPTLIELPKTNTGPLSEDLLYENNSKVLTIGSTFELENIYYDFSDHQLRPEAKKSLDKLVYLLQLHPSLEIELAAHTDSRGDADDNQVLSQRRANRAAKYLIRKGISASRLTPKGYGEAILRNHCSDGVDCPEDAHQDNRRTEVKILKLN